MYPPPPAAAPLELVLTTTSIRNVTLATDKDDFYYEVVTPSWDALNTKIKKLDRESGKMTVIAEMKKERESSQCTGLRFTSPDKEDAAFVSPDTFLLTDGAGGKVLGTFVGENGNRYRWRESKGSIELIKADEADHQSKPLARLHKHHRHLGVLRMSEKPRLEVDAELAGSMNTFIVSFLLAEGKRRWKA